MYLQKLSITNFKNHSEAGFEFSEKINCFIGNNGVGKTNILDAIYYLSFCKSYFNQVDVQNIKHGEDFFAVHGTYLKNKDKTDLVSCVQQRNHKKQFKLNKKTYSRLADHIGLFPLVMVSPYDRDLINEGSEVRRKYLDSVISQFDKIYLDDLIKYNKALAQRNVLLKHFAEGNYFDGSALVIWDEQLINLGKEIYRKRKDFFNLFTPIFQKYYSFVSLDKEVVSIKYDSHLADGDFALQLKESLSRDRMLRYTTVGIHKDDLVLRINGYPVKKFGSQGQQKSFVIAIKLAQFDYTSEIKGYKPVLLFDDIFDKLDKNRVKQIVKLVSENSFGQVFITDTQKERIKSVFLSLDIEHKVFEIINGDIELLEQ